MTIFIPRTNCNVQSWLAHEGRELRIPIAHVTDLFRFVQYDIDSTNYVKPCNDYIKFQWNIWFLFMKKCKYEE